MNSNTSVLRIMQWNTNGVKSRLTQLSKFMGVSKVGVALIQESFVREESEKKVEGFNKIVTERLTARNGNVNGIKGDCLLALIKDNLHHSCKDALTLKTVKTVNDTITELQCIRELKHREFYDDA